MTAPLISLMMTVGPERRFLGHALDSVTGQKFDDFGLVLVFDGPAEPVDVRNLESRWSGDPAGRLTSLKRAATLASGQWLAWLDADDTLHPAALAKMADTIRRNPTAKTIFSGWTRQGVPMTPFLASDPFKFCAAHLTVTRRDVFEQVGGFGTMEVGMFFDLRLRLQEAGDVLAIADPLYHFRSHPAQISQTRRAEQLESMKDAAERAEERRSCLT